jgi:hypothetical protein
MNSKNNEVAYIYTPKNAFRKYVCFDGVHFSTFVLFTTTSIPVTHLAFYSVGTTTLDPRVKQPNVTSVKVQNALPAGSCMA